MINDWFICPNTKLLSTSKSLPGMTLSHVTGNNFKGELHNQLRRERHFFTFKSAYAFSEKKAERMKKKKKELL